MGPVAVALRVSASSSFATDTVSPTEVIATGSVEYPSTAGEDDSHASRLEEVVVPRINKMNRSFSLVSLVHFT